MPKIIIEIEANLKKKFILKCAKEEKTQKEVLTRFINKWVKK